MRHLYDKINEILPEMVSIRRRIHQTPELKYEEFQTAAIVAEKLTSFGIQVKQGIAKTGIIAIIDSGKPGKTIALRADMDALPIHEMTGLQYQSQHENKMHACGHDGHTATLLLTAYLLQNLKDQFQGKVKLIFQPAEEGGKGSTAMIADGVLENPSVDAIFGWHVWPGMELGMIGTRSGTILAGNGRFEITIQGSVAHMSMPERAVNPVTIGALLITAIDKLRGKYRNEYVVLNLIRFTCGEMKGGMTDSAKVLGVYFIENDAVLSKIKSDIDAVIKDIIHISGSTIHVEYTPFHTPTINTENETELVLLSASEVVDSDNIIKLPSVMTAAEDFSEYLRKIPGCFFLIGAGLDYPNVHTNMFDFPDDIIPIAALTMLRIVMNYSKAG